MDGVVQTASEAVLVAELASLSLEFTRLSQPTGDAEYYDAIQRPSQMISRETKN